LSLYYTYCPYYLLSRYYTYCPFRISTLQIKVVLRRVPSIGQMIICISLLDLQQPLVKSVGQVVFFARLVPRLCATRESMQTPTLAPF
jgi:hypothetical protein